MNDLQVGEKVYYKFPDRWGSPIERGVVVKMCGTRPAEMAVCVSVGDHLLLLPGNMLKRTAREALEWAQSINPDDSHGIFLDYNRKVLSE